MNSTLAAPIWAALALMRQPWISATQTYRNVVWQRGSSVRFYAKQLPPRRKVDEAEIEENFLRGTGPGGQKINKTSSAVQLKHLPTGLVVKCQDTRSRSQNREIARRLLSERLEVLEQGDQSRVMVKAAAALRKKASADKKKRRKYRKLQEQEQDRGESQKKILQEQGQEQESAQEETHPVFETEHRRGEGEGEGFGQVRK